jgi:hypothetical protein
MAVGTALDRRLMRKAGALRRAVAIGMAVHAARMLEHLAGFDEEGRGARGGIANGGERARIAKRAAALGEHRRGTEPRDRRQTEDERHARPHDVRVPAGASRANGSRRTR